jgi:DNA adenine methylase
MKYLTVKETAENWGVSERWVERLCHDDRVEGVKIKNDEWFIPLDAVKPLNLRNENKRFAGLHAKPFIKWAGGKGQILDEIRKHYPPELGKTITKYAEPFVGGGAVLFDVINNYKLKKIYISDNNKELITTYLVIKNHVNKLIDELSILEKEYLPLSTPDRKKYYMTVREDFNYLKIMGDFTTEVTLAADFIFLNRTCFNGLYRVNRHGLFNVPMGAYKNPKICDRENLKLVSKKLRNVQIECADFKDSRKFIDDKTFVYFDPPYRPLSATANFTSYTEGEFSDNDQIALAQYVQLIDKSGAKIVISNSDPKNTNDEDNFFDDLYKKQTIHRIKANRMINSKATSRGKINELLISNF